MKYNYLFKKNHQEISGIFKDSIIQKTNDLLIVLLEKQSLGKKKCLYIFFEDNIVVRISVRIKNFWQAIWKP
ncbi:hypothetical protein [Chryseobacterium gambrini]|uniref:Uncharacterized protein n=1 Tax=Chryseobacterium gambrini TaxID=373672 RepID=A0ABM8K580_9FLAO|nr:hypothetical protein CRDW_11310 [Chryseobacterium gambrini]